MDFQLLGPLEVRSERGAVGLGGLKPRAILAMLLLHANEPVSAERLAVGLWGEDAPAGAVKTVQVHVSRLRKALGDPEALTTTPAGYRLRVRPGELDAERFARGVAQGRRALDAGDFLEDIIFERHRRLPFRCLLGHRGQLLEGFRIADGQLGQELAIDIHVGFLEPADEHAVGKTMLARRGIDAGDPQLTEIALLPPAVLVGVLKPTEDRFFGGFEKTTPAAKVASGG